MKSLRSLRQHFGQFNAVLVGHVCRLKTNEWCLLSKKAPQVARVMLVNNTTSSPLYHKTLSKRDSFTGSFGNVQPFWLTPNVPYPNNFIKDCTKEIKLPTMNSNTPGIPVLPKVDTIGDIFEDNKIIGYEPTVSEKPGLSCSNILKKRKKKMNKHKYKKRRKRDKFKRRNLENIKERKRRAKEKAAIRAKQALA
ncbi:hypothetical protein QZH41_018490 [Actinostola sp. cb2023]|nr:hypothetical protein QZH41_018490 [Actinostola sp. cb2023]